MSSRLRNPFDPSLPSAGFTHLHEYDDDPPSATSIDPPAPSEPLSRITVNTNYPPQVTTMNSPPGTPTGEGQPQTGYSFLNMIARTPSQLSSLVGTAAVHLFPSAQTEVFDIDPPDNKKWLRMILWFAAIVLFALCLYGITVLSITDSATVFIMFLFLFLMVYVTYLWSHLTANGVEYLRNIVVDEGTSAFVSGLVATRPTVTMSIRCYHFEGDDGGGAAGELEDGGESVRVRPRVYTFEQSREFVFDQWEDLSVPLTLVERAEIIKLKFKSRIGFADSFTKEKFDEEQARFVAEHKDRDANYEYKTIFQVPGMHKVLSVVHLDRWPRFLGYQWYLLFTVFFAGWPYLIWLDRNSTKVNYLLKKVVKRTATPEELARRRVSGVHSLGRKGTNASIRPTSFTEAR